MLNEASYNLLASFDQQGLSPREMIHVFDMDDTLLRTKEIILDAYERAGVHRYKAELNWGRAADEWVNSDERTLKKYHYAKILFSGRTPQTTALYDAARSGLLGTHCLTLTGASVDSYNMLQQTVGFLPPLLGTGVSRGKKGDALFNIASTMIDKPIRRDIVFYDDSETEVTAALCSYDMWPKKHKEQVKLYIGYYNYSSMGGPEKITFFRTDGEQSWTLSF